MNIITADMSFGWMFLLGLILTNAGIGFIVSSVFLWRLAKACNFFRPIEEEYLEADELVYHGWEDPEKMPVPVKVKEPKHRRVPIEHIEV